MTDEELITRLRDPFTDGCEDLAADHIEALVRKLAWTEAKLEAEELTSGLKLNEATARAERLEAALRKLHHAVCGETGFAACVRLDSGKAYPWPALDDADEAARAALTEIKGE